MTAQITKTWTWTECRLSEFLFSNVPDINIELREQLKELYNNFHIYNLNVGLMSLINKTSNIFLIIVLPNVIYFWTLMIFFNKVFETT